MYSLFAFGTAQLSRPWASVSLRLRIPLAAFFVYTHVRFDPLATALTPAAFLIAVASIAWLHRPHGAF